MASLHEVQAKQQHQAAELYGQVDETTVRVAASGKEQSAQGRRVKRQVGELSEVWGSLSEAQKTIDQLRREVALAAE